MSDEKRLEDSVAWRKFYEERARRIATAKDLDTTRADLTAARTRVAELEGGNARLVALGVAGADNYGQAIVALADALHERDAYKRAKEENDERFMTERDQARAEVAALRETLGWAANLADPLYSFGVSERLALGRKAREVLGLPALDASPQADRPRFVDPGRGPRQAVVASPQAAPPGTTRVFDGKNWRETPACAECGLDTVTYTLVSAGKTETVVACPDCGPATPVQGAPHACRLSCVEPGHDEWVAAVQGAPPEVIPAINGPWIPGAAPADGPTCAAWCGHEVGTVWPVVDSFQRWSTVTHSFCSADCRDAGRPLHPAPAVPEPVRELVPYPATPAAEEKKT
jgi:hypothetical protein